MKMFCPILVMPCVERKKRKIGRTVLTQKLIATLPIKPRLFIVPPLPFETPLRPYGIETIQLYRC